MNLHRYLPYGHFIDILLLSGHQAEDIISFLRLFHIPMPDDITKLIQARLQDLLLDKKLAKQYAQLPRPINAKNLPKHLQGPFTYFKYEMPIWREVRELSLHIPIRQAIELYAHKLALKKGPLPQQLGQKDFVLIAQNLQKVIGRTTSKESIALLVLLFFDISALNSLHLVQFFNTLPTPCYRLHREILTLSEQDIAKSLDQMPLSLIAKTMRQTISKSLDYSLDQKQIQHLSKLLPTLESLTLDNDVDKDIELRLALCDTQTGLRTLSEIQKENDAIPDAK